MRDDPTDTPSPAPATPGVLTGALAGAVRRMLRPLVHLLVAQQVPYGFVANLLKGVYVDVAEHDFPLAGKRQTDSRISLLTGVHRKDVRRLRNEPIEADTPPASVSLGAQLVAHWNGVDRFLDSDGSPLPLPLQSERDGDPSFEALVADVSTDIRSRSVLDEWLRLGVVHFDTAGRVVLDAGVFVPQQGLEEKLFYFGRNLHDHVATSSHNVLGHQPPHLERSVHYGMLDAEAARELSELATESGMRALQSVNRRALELRERDASNDAPTRPRRILFGVYFHEAPDTAADTGDADDA